MKKVKPQRAHMVGKAGEYRVMAELLLRGYHPRTPALDNGCDIMLDNGVRIQVKTSHLQAAARSYANGYYRFQLMECSRGIRYQNIPRDWTKRCDFLILWCINEDRFFILPPTTGVTTICVKHRSEKQFPVVNVEAAKRMYAQGVTIRDISRELGVSWPTVKAAILGQRKNRNDLRIQRILQFESRWDLLDVNSAVEKLVESAEPVSVTKEN